MRVKNSMRNMIYIYGSTLLLAILNLIVRRVFLDVLTVDYLGYDGLFTSIFSFLSLSEMGIASIITYHMYSEIANDNTDEIRKLLYIYKLIYRCVGIFVLTVGIIVSLFLPMILTTKQKESWLFIYVIYFLQLSATLCTYFLAYRRILFTTDQRIYVCTAVDTTVNMVVIVLKMVVLFTLKNYIVYLIVAILGNIVSNAIIARKSYKEYPKITAIDVSVNDIKELNLFHEVKNMLATKIAITIYGSSNDIIITRILGVTMTGMVSNYKMISSKIQEMILALFSSLQASIGNLVYSDEKQKGENFFYALDLAGFFMALVCATGVVTAGQSAILLWLKNDKFLLPYAFLVLLALNMYIAISNNPMTYFRNSLGHFETDRNYMIAAAVVNLILTIVFSLSLGITGAMIGTICGHLLIYLGRTVVMHKYFLKKSIASYIFLFFGRVILLGISCGLSVFISRIIFSHTGLRSVAGFLLSGVISVLISVTIFILSSLKTESLKTLLAYVSIIFNMIKGRKKKAA